MSHHHPQSFHHERDPRLHTREHRRLTTAASVRDLGRLLNLVAEDLASEDPERFAAGLTDEELTAQHHPEVEAALTLNSALDLIDSAIRTLESDDESADTDNQ